MFRTLLFAVCLWSAQPLAAQEGHTRRTAAEMLAVMTGEGGRVITDREVNVTGEYSDFTFEAGGTAGW